MGCDALYDARLAISGKDVALFDLATWKNGLAFKKIDFSDSGIPVIKIAELNNGIGSSTSFTRGVYSSDVKLQRGDFLFSWSGNPETSIDIFRFELEEGWLNQHIFKTTPNSSLVTWDYFFYLMKWLKPVFKSIASNKQTTGLGHITISDLKKIKVTVPAKDFQDKVAAILTAIDNKISLNAKLNGYLAEYLKSCAKRLYREYERDEEADLSEGWHWTTIGEISEMVCRGITPKYNDESDELILGQTCIRNNLVLLDNGRLHAPRKITEKWLKKYDLLINSTGVGSLGRTAQVWFDPSKLVVDSHVTIVRAADPRHALYMGFWAFEHERYIESLHTGSTGQTELPRDHVKAIRLVLPSDAELEKFNAVAQPAVELIVANQKESKRLAELRDTLLPKLMSGEIDVSSVAI